MILFDKIMISCKQATYLHEKRKEGKLDGMEKFGLWVHLVYCRFCALFIKQMAQIEVAANRFYQNTERFNLSDKRKAEIKKAFDEQLNK